MRVKPAGDECDGMGRAARQKVGPFIGGTVQGHDFFHNIQVGFHQGNHRFHPKQVGSDQVAHMQHVALKHFRIMGQGAQLDQFFGQLNLEGVFDSLDGGQGMADGTDSADAGNDALHLVPFAPPNESLEKSRGFGNLPFGLFDLPVGSPNHDIAVALDPGDVMHIDLDVFRHGRAPCWS